MKKLILFLILIAVGFSNCQNGSSNLVNRSDTKILVFSSEDITLNESEEYVHTTDLSYLEEKNLFDYSTLVLYSAAINELKPYHKSAIQRYVQAGGGLMSINNDEPLPYFWYWWEKMHKAIEGEGTVSSEYDGGKIVIAKDSLSLEETASKVGDMLAFTVGENSYDLSKVTTPAAPYDHNFTRLTLDDDTDEPMEMAILPDNRVIWIERRGKMKIYEPKNEATRLLHTFDVCTAGNYEDGLLGLELDPNYGKDNHYLYMYYSPVCDTPYQFLSRFVFKDDSIHLNTEIVMLKVFVQRETCCHSGGSIEFGDDGLLYLSTGDNTSSKESDGFTPIDERPGRGPFDAQKSSGNTHDLRGKILRIKPLADGTYEIPDGNLFPKDGSNGRPEIFVMGARNPFRIAIDKNNYVYWGDVGPDGGVDGKYGPQSYDEWNQAREAGNYGWPYFVGDNKAYRDRDFATDEVGDFFDPAKPINESPYNTGSKVLPPAQPAMIWYPYGKSPEFPLLGTGSRSAMAGPFFYKEPGHRKFSSMPDYLEGKMIIYEWAQSWMMLLSFDDNQDLVQMEYFLPNMPISKPIDMKFGPDGALYILEYGASYFLDNPDAALTRIEYSEINKPPHAELKVDVPHGIAPLTVNFSAKGSFDYDSDEELTYEWYFTDTKTPQATGKEASFTFEKMGVYQPILKVIDKDKAATEATTDIWVGNAPPEVDIALNGNTTFFFENQNALNYEVSIKDLEDESSNGINENNASLDFSYIKDVDYFNALRKGKKPLPESSLKFVQGKKLIDESDCKTCHAKETKVNGPSYQQIAQRYSGQYTAVEQLAQKVIKGGNGVWGETMMSAHPQLSVEDAQEMIKYILSVGDVNEMPLKGAFDIDGKAEGGYLVSATYKDNGANNIAPITARKVHFLRSPIVQAEHYDISNRGRESRFGIGLQQTQVGGGNGENLVFKNIDLTGVGNLTFKAASLAGGKIEVRIDDLEGKVIGSVTLPKGSWEKREDWKLFTTRLNAEGIHDVYIIFVNDERQPVGNIDWMKFEQ